MILFLIIVDILLFCSIFLILYLLFKEQQRKYINIQFLQEGLSAQNVKNQMLCKIVIISNELIANNRKKAEVISKEIYELQKMFFKFFS